MSQIYGVAGYDRWRLPVVKHGLSARWSTSPGLGGCFIGRWKGVGEGLGYSAREIRRRGIRQLLPKETMSHSCSRETGLAEYHCAVQQRWQLTIRRVPPTFALAFRGTTSLSMMVSPAWMP